MQTSLFIYYKYLQMAKDNNNNNKRYHEVEQKTSTTIVSEL